MEGTQGFEHRPCGLDGKVRADNGDDVAGVLDLFGQFNWVKRHGAPAADENSVNRRPKSSQSRRGTGFEAEISRCIGFSAVGRPFHSVVEFSGPKFPVDWRAGVARVVHRFRKGGRERIALW